MLSLPLKNPQPDIDHFVRVIRGETIPQRPPLIELYLDLEIVREISTTCLGRTWAPPSDDRAEQEQYLRNWIEVHHRMGYDSLRVGGGLEFTANVRRTEDTAALSKGSRCWAEEGKGPISSWEDFAQYPWPDVQSIDLWQYEFIAEQMPEGMGMLLSPCSGFLELPLDALIGYENMCYLLYDEPELVAAVMRKVGEVLYGYYERLIALPRVYGVFQGDDMGFSTGTLVSPAVIREHVLPWHTKLAALAHERNLIYLLHSCGNLGPLVEDLLTEVGIDGRHSFEDKGNSVLDFKRQYGHRVAVLGGIDMDKLARLPLEELRRHVRATLDACMPGGRYLLGSGNSIANYIPLPNYFAMVEEGLNYG